MKKFQTITGENISIKKGLEIKAELETMVNDINEGKVNRKQLKELCSEFVKKQNKGKLEGFWAIILDDYMPSDARIDFLYWPTYCITMAMMVAYMMKLNDEIEGFDDCFKLGLEACTKRNFRGYTYEAQDGRIKVLSMFIESGLFVFLKENKNLCPRFNVCIKRIFTEMQERLDQGNTICDLGIDYEEEFKNIIKLKENSKLKLFVYGTLMFDQSNHGLLSQANVLGDAVAEGFELYDTGFGYPAAKHSEKDSIEGELYTIDYDLLKNIDILESNGNLYTREFTIVKDKTGKSHLAIIYVYNKDVYEENKTQSWKEKTEDNYLWYASYGSNLNYNRFMDYINSCDDTTPPIASKQVLINHKLYFANKSCIWENKGVAFIDPKEDKNEVTLGRMYLITKDQFEQIKLFEGSKYQNKVRLGTYDGKEIVTFTDYEVNEENLPSERYVEIIQKGLRETYKSLSKDQIIKYLDCRINKNIADKAESI